MVFRFMFREEEEDIFFLEQRDEEEVEMVDLTLDLTLVEEEAAASGSW